MREPAVGGGNRHGVVAADAGSAGPCRVARCPGRGRARRAILARYLPAGVRRRCDSRARRTRCRRCADGARRGHGGGRPRAPTDRARPGRLRRRRARDDDATHPGDADARHRGRAIAPGAPAACVARRARERPLRAAALRGCRSTCRLCRAGRGVDAAARRPWMVGRGDWCEVGSESRPYRFSRPCLVRQPCRRRGARRHERARLHGAGAAVRAARRTRAPSVRTLRRHHRRPAARGRAARQRVA